MNTKFIPVQAVQIKRTLSLPVLFLLSGVMGLSPSSAYSIPATPPPAAFSFQPGESLSYVISWAGIPVGSATMEIDTATPIERQPTLRLVTTAKSNKYLSKFFPVSNRVESTVNAQSLLPFQMVFQRREGKRHDDFDITFDRQEKRVQVIKNGKTTIRDIPPDIHDALSCLYYLRLQPSLDSGSSVLMQIHHNKKNYEVEAKVEGVESLTGPWGTVPAIRVLVIMPFQGIFLNEGNIRVWLTKDRTHTPLMMKAKITIGSIKAILQHSLSS
jgi:hypothetical protein